MECSHNRSRRSGVLLVFFVTSQLLALFILPLAALIPLILVDVVDALLGRITGSTNFFFLSSLSSIHSYFLR